MDGSYGPAAIKETEAFVGAELKSAVVVPVKLWDERLTSAQANRYLIQGNVRREDRKQKVDKTAAAILLQRKLFGFAEQRMNALKFKLTIAYDGTDYAGAGRCRKAGSGVQQRVEEALRKLFPSVGRIHSSSRTDAGVHALGMVAHVEIARAEFKMAAAKLALAINAHLPEGHSCVIGPALPGGFPRALRRGRQKQYRYFVWNHPAMNPLLRHQAWRSAAQTGCVRGARSRKIIPGQARFQIARGDAQLRNGIDGAHFAPV